MDLKILKDIRTLILNGDFQEGEPITEATLTKRLKKGRPPVREALAHLAGEGLVSLRGGSSATVCRMKENEAFCVAAARIEVERIAATLICQQAKTNEKQIDELKDLHNKMKQVADDTIGTSVKKRVRRKFVALDCDFHCMIVALAGIDPEGAFMRHLFNRTHILASNGLSNPEILHEVIDEHDKIVNAIESASPHQTCDSVKHHLRASIRRWFPQKGEDYLKLL